MKKVSVFLLALVLVLALTACGCEHEFAAADCVNPPTCTLCGKTEGDALGHVWMAATCDTPKACEVCGTADGEPKGHSMVEATCDEAKHCENCDLTEGEPLGHVWQEATTELPQTCEICALTEGERIITDSRFTTAATAELQGKWLMEVELTGEMMGIPEFPAGAMMNFVMLLGNDGNADITVEVTDSFMEALNQYTIDMMYAEFAAQGLGTEDADSMFEAAYGMTIQDYVAEEISSVNMDDIYASLFAAMDIGGVYYVADGLLYTGSDWEDTMEATEYSLEGDTLVLQQIAEELGNDGKFIRVAE